MAYLILLHLHPINYHNASSQLSVKSFEVYKARLHYFFMETVEDIVIIGAGISGLTTALGLHRNGIRSLVLESSHELRVAGFAFLNWTNAWKALDVLGVGDSLRQHHLQLKGVSSTSTVSGLRTSEMTFEGRGKIGDHEVRCVKRKALLETLAKGLPQGTIRFSSRVVFIEEENQLRVVHLADGSTFKTKVLIGCDGVNSVVAKFLGIQRPLFSGRWATRGIADFPNGQNFEPKFQLFFGNGYRSGFIPCDQHTMYWFFTYSAPDTRQESPMESKQFVLKNLGKVPEEITAIVEQTNLEDITVSPLRFRNPFNLLWAGAIYKDNVCVTGDALHPMTPDIGQGGCSALEDGIVLSRCLSEVFLREKIDNKEEYDKIKSGLKQFADQRKWRSFELIATAYMVGLMQQSSGKIVNFFTRKILALYLVGLLLKRADFDCGSLTCRS